MVGLSLSSAIKTSHQTPNLKEEEEQPIELEDLTFPLLDPLTSFDFIDDWLVDNDSLNMSNEEEDGGCSELKRLDFDDGEKKVASLIEEEMGKVSLVEGGGGHDNDDVHHSSVKVDYDELKEDGVVQGNAESREMSREDEEEEEEEESSSSSSDSSEAESENSSSGESSSSSSDDAEEEVDGSVEMEEGEIKGIDLEEMLAGSDEDELVVKGPIKSKNEIEFLPPVPPVDVKLEPHHQVLPVGAVLSIMDAKVVVEGLENHNPLNEGSILWLTESRSPLGIVDEIFGPVKNPFYIVRYNSDKEIPAGVCQGTPVSFVTDFADHVLNDKNLYKKGYDASGENDEEISDEVEFSDDEKEAEYRRAQKMANKSANDRKRGNQEFVARKKVQQNGSWKNTQPPDQAFPKHTGQTNIRSQRSTPPVEQSFSAGSTSCSFSPRPVSTGGPFLAPPGSQLAQANCSQNLIPANGGVNFCTLQNFATANGGWTNGMPGQLPQHMVFPNGYAMNGMPIQPLHHFQQTPQMFNSFPNGVPFQQQFDPSQMMMHNVPLPYGQPNFPPMLSAPWQWHPGQPNQAQFGMGLQGQHMQSPVNAGNQQGNGQDNTQSTEMLPPPNMQGNFPAHHQHNQGRPPPPSNMQGNFPAHQQHNQGRPPSPSNMQGNFPAHQQHNQGRPPSPSNMQGNFPAHQHHNQGRPPTRGGRSYHRGRGRFSGRRGRG